MNIPSFGMIPKFDPLTMFGEGDPGGGSGYGSGFDFSGIFGEGDPGGGSGYDPSGSQYITDTNNNPDLTANSTTPTGTGGINLSGAGSGGGGISGFRLPFGLSAGQLATLIGGAGAAAYGINATGNTQQDVSGAATAQGANNVATAGQESQLNNPNMVTPYGSSTYSIGPDGRPVLTQSLSPAEQAKLTAQQRLQMDMLGSAGSMLRTPFGLPGAIPTADAGTLDAAERAMYSRGAQYLDPQFERAGSDLRTRLANQGITPGSAAYARAMDEEGLRSQKAYSDLRDQAVAHGLLAEKTQFDMGLAGRQQGYNEYTNNRQMPIQLLSQLLQGSSVNNPQFQPTQSSRIQPAPIYQAGLANANLSQGNLQNIFNLISRFGGSLLNQPGG